VGRAFHPRRARDNADEAALALSAAKGVAGLKTRDVAARTMRRLADSYVRWPREGFYLGCACPGAAACREDVAIAKLRVERPTRTSCSDELDRLERTDDVRAKTP
jgi:hypothetical protein